MTKDPFVLHQQQDPFTGKKKVGEITITMFDGGPPNLKLGYQPQNMHPMTVAGLLIDTLTIAYRMLAEEIKRLNRSNIEIVKTGDDRGLRNGN